MDEKVTSWSGLKRIAAKQFGKKKAPLPKGMRRCCMCEIPITRIEYVCELGWLPASLRRRKAACRKCVNRLWVQEQGSSPRGKG